ncbi:MAG: YbjQ family protein [Planctomycetes bacterium]|nr:YbjQ family protein [Planctomycetota bacterium]
MILASREDIPQRRVSEVLGLVRGSSVRARHLGRDIGAALKNLVGGEIPEYTKLLAESREQALDRMLEEARALGADAIVAVRFASSEVSRHAAEVLVYGTAVKLAPHDKHP